MEKGNATEYRCLMEKTRRLTLQRGWRIAGTNMASRFLNIAGIVGKERAAGIGAR
jgi:hypothetical protein